MNTRLDSSEFQVEYDPPHTIELVKHGIKAMGYEYVFIEADENCVENLKKEKPNLVFNRAEGIRGDSRESHVPAMLEMLGIPYIGSNVLVTAVCLNKAWTKMVLEHYKLPTAKFFMAKDIESLKDFNVPFPVILKPNEEGSSVGINEDNVVSNLSGLKKKITQMFKDYKQPILIEQFIKGREFSIGVLGNPGNYEVLSIIEVDFSKLPAEVGNVFGQRAKTSYDDLNKYPYVVCPAQIPVELKTKLEKLAVSICEVLDIKEFARMDFRMNAQGEVFFLEINPLPGIDFDLEHNDFSFYPYMAFKSGLSYDQLIMRLIYSACARYSLTK